MKSGAGTPTAPAASVVVCTRNRASLLDGCLERLLALDNPDGGMEIVVVDNGSTDATPLVVERWGGRGVEVRYVHEPHVGISPARNTGVAAARGRIVLFVDDDVRVPCGWARAHLEAHRRWAGVAAVGGPVHLMWPGVRPSWLTAGFERWYSAVDLGTEARPVRADEILVTANLSLDRSAVIGVGGFRPELGRRGRSLVSSEDIDLTRRLLRSQWSVAYEPAADVLHLVDPRRIRRRWLLRRALAQGRSDAMVQRLNGAPDDPPSVSEALVAGFVRGWRTGARSVVVAKGARREAALKEALRRCRVTGYAVQRVVDAVVAPHTDPHPDPLPDPSPRARTRS